jgi:hypothetical protein
VKAAAAASALGGREGDEEGIPLGVDLDPALGGAGGTDHLAVGGERLRVGLRPQLLEQPGRALDVGEEEGDGAGGELPHTANDPTETAGRPVPVPSSGQAASSERQGLLLRQLQALSPRFLEGRIAELGTKPLYGALVVGRIPARQTHLCYQTL